MDSNPYEPIDVERPASANPHPTFAGAILVMLGGSLVALSLFLLFAGLFLGVVQVLVPELIPPAQPGEPPNEAMPFIAALEALFFIVPGAGYSVTAYGVFKRKKWAWFAGLVAFALSMGGCCFPLGVYGIYALLNEKSRREFGM